MRKAALFLQAAFLVLFANWAWAKPESIKPELERAQQVFLNKNRPGAIKILQKIRTNNLKAEEKEELQETLKDLATRFLSDQGQRSYELGISQLPGQTSSALNHLNEADQLENGNLEISMAILRAHIAGEDCRAAARVLPKLMPLASVLPKLVELELQLAWCTEKNQDVEVILKRKTNETKLSPALQKVANAWLKWRSKEHTRAVALLREAIALEPRNPAALYWLWRVLRDQDLDAQTEAAAFSKRCRNFDAEFRRQTSSMIELCLHNPEVEAYLKAKGAENADAE